MTQPALTNAVNTAKTVFINSLQLAFAQAASQVVTNALDKEAGTPLQVSVPGYDAQANIDPATGKVMFSGNVVTEIETMLAVANSLHQLLGTSPAPPAEEPVAVAPVEPVAPVQSA
jgi:hypothetical protein